MPLRLEIPKELSHLRVDERGYPIPFFVPIHDGQPNFRLQDERKQHLCMEQHLCGICGKKLYKDYHYFISGPKGLKNRVSSDAAMHRVCAEFAILACPHIRYQDAERKDTKKGIENWFIISDKPDTMIVVKSSHYRIYTEPLTMKKLYRYRPVAGLVYTYKDGIIEFSHEETY